MMVLVVDLHCKDFKDNTRAIELAKVPKMHPRTKHINPSTPLWQVRGGWYCQGRVC
jgi:hypothetical protein